jgi:hypothetical protein
MDGSPPVRVFVATLSVAASFSVGACASAPLAEEPADPPRIEAPGEPHAVLPAPATTDATATREPEPEYCDTENPEVPVPDRRLYATWQTLPLNAAEHGIDGTLRVLQDSRFTKPGSRHGTHPLIKPCDPLQGRIEILDAAGRTVSSTLESPQIDVTAHSFAPGQTVYQTRTLVLCLASCWCGDYVSFFRVQEGRIVPFTTQRASGEALPVQGITRGCYGGGGVERRPDGHLEVAIHRTILLIPDAVSVEEHHVWDGHSFRGAVSETRRPW